MSVAYIDRDSTLNCEEEGGVIRSLTRLCTVVGLADLDFRVLWSGLQAAGIPQVPAQLTEIDGSLIPGFEMLLLTHRHAQVVNNDTGTVDVTLRYEHLLERTAQELSVVSPTGNPGLIYGKMRCSIHEKPTNLYRKWDRKPIPIVSIAPPTTEFPNWLLTTVDEHGLLNGEQVTITGVVNPDNANDDWTVDYVSPTQVMLVDSADQLDGFDPTDPDAGDDAVLIAKKTQQITVEHTFPDSDPDYKGKTLAERTKVQGGKVQVVQPQRNLHFTGYVQTDQPNNLANALIATVNKTPWAGQNPREWLCTEVLWEIAKANRYRYAFEFQHNPDTWDPFVVYIDDRSGRPPVGLKEGVGWKQVPALKAVDYNEILNVFVDNVWGIIL